MGQARVIPAPRGPRPIAAGTIEMVFVMASGTLNLSRKLADRLGNPARVVLLTTIGPDRLGVRAATASEASVRLDTSQFGIRVNTFVALWSLGRRSTGNQTLPHSWTGNLLVVDVSGMPKVVMGVTS